MACLHVRVGDAWDARLHCADTSSPVHRPTHHAVLFPTSALPMEPSGWSCTGIRPVVSIARSGCDLEDELPRRHAQEMPKKRLREKKVSIDQGRVPVGLAPGGLLTWVPLALSFTVIAPRTMWAPCSCSDGQPRSGQQAMPPGMAMRQFGAAVLRLQHRDQGLSHHSRGPVKTLVSVSISIVSVRLLESSAGVREGSVARQTSKGVKDMAAHSLSHHFASQ